MLGFTRHRTHTVIGKLLKMEQSAHNVGMVGLFITISPPCRFHAVSPWFDGSTPQQAHAFLRAFWQKASRTVSAARIQWTGMKLAEPHRDGTPHWHVIVWTFPASVDTIRSTLRNTLRDVCPDDRCLTVTELQRGDVAMYAAKYLSSTNTPLPLLASWLTAMKISVVTFFGILAGRVA
ncbi:replication endonuclease [Silvimonas sp.]|uniref:replication endonuclease n=1 Tax=Silvimonas sp. TaxID=2650811 RepID=UPI00284D11B3|nr:replication endonuclease [Silvimonas sp.]MDR3429704.1 replication endonuclease [Silvimonas sp.]